MGVIRSIRRQAPGCKVEVLTPDFRGQEMPLARVVHERPDVFNHNVETVPRLYPVARRGSDFLRSARVLRMAKEMAGDEVVTKSGLMVGLGEEFDEMVEAFGILREHRVQVLTVGQYLRPTEKHLPVDRYWHPDEFAALEKAAYELGFESVASGPLVRSSYHADEQLPAASSALGHTHLSLQRRVSGIRSLAPCVSADAETWLCLLAAALLVALAAGPLTGGAVSQTTGEPPNAKNPLAGDGMWIWYLSRSSHGKRRRDRERRLTRDGIETVLIKSGDGTQLSGASSRRRLVDRSPCPRAATSAPGSSSTGAKPGKEAQRRRRRLRPRARTAS